MVKFLGTNGNGAGVREKQKQLKLTLNNVTLSALYISLDIVRVCEVKCIYICILFVVTEHNNKRILHHN